jgi:hypothetical protein
MEQEWVDPSRLLGFLREHTHARVVVAALCGIVLFAPAPMVAVLRLEPVRERFVYIAGVAFLISIVSLATSLGGSLHARYSPVWEESGRKEKMRQLLHQLSQYEQAILMLYVHRRTNTPYFDLRNGYVAGLARDGILFQVTSDGFIHSWAFKIEPWVREYLDNNRDLLRDAGPPSPGPIPQDQALDQGP